MVSQNYYTRNGSRGWVKLTNAHISFKTIFNVFFFIFIAIGYEFLGFYANQLNLVEINGYGGLDYNKTMFHIKGADGKNLKIVYHSECRNACTLTKTKPHYEACKYRNNPKADGKFSQLFSFLVHETSFLKNLNL